MGCPPPQGEEHQVVQARRGGSGARGEAVGALGAHAPLLERAGRVLLGGGGVRHGHEASRPARGGGEGGFAFSYFKSQKTLLALLLPGPGTLVGAVGICGAGRGTGGGPGFCPPPGGRPGPFPANFRLDGGGFLGPLFLTEGPAPTTFVEDEQQLGGRAGPEQGQGRGRAVRGRARAVRASRQEAAPVVHAPGCAHHRPALHPCRGWRARPPKVPLATPARGHPPGACSCARRGS